MGLRAGLTLLLVILLSFFLAFAGALRLLARIVQPLESAPTRFPVCRQDRRLDPVGVEPQTRGRDTGAMSGDCHVEVSVGGNRRMRTDCRPRRPLVCAS